MRTLAASLLIVALAGFNATCSLAQKKKKGEEEMIEAPEFNIAEDTELITYTEVMQVAGAKADLYRKGLKWFNTYFKNPANVIKEKDEEGGKIYGKHRFKLSMVDAETGVTTGMGMVMYEITLWLKDGRYKYKLDKFNWKKSSAFPLEKVLEENNKKYTREYASHLRQTDEYARKLIKNLVGFMGAPPKPKAEDW